MHYARTHIFILTDLSSCLLNKVPSFIAVSTPSNQRFILALLGPSFSSSGITNAGSPRNMQNLSISFVSFASLLTYCLLYYLSTCSDRLHGFVYGIDLCTRNFLQFWRSANSKFFSMKKKKENQKTKPKKKKEAYKPKQTNKQTNEQKQKKGESRE